ncbi:hypothetical protein HYDPIDRAFT_111182, partial [Hydnomerulius pinastri MD-312]
MIRRPTNVSLLTDCHRKAALSTELLPETEISDPIVFAHVGHIEKNRIWAVNQFNDWNQRLTSDPADGIRI